MPILRKFQKKSYKSRRSIPSKKKTIKKALAKRSATRIKKVVNQVLSKRVETKVLQTAGNFDIKTLQASTTSTQFDQQCICVTPQGGTITGFLQLYPILGNGIGQDQRVGDECKIKGIYIDALIQANDYDATFNPVPLPQIVTVWLVRPKIRNSFGLAFNQIIGGTTEAIFFENQTNATSGLSGHLVDMLRKVDTDNFQVLAKRQFKIGWQGQLNTTNVVTSLQVNDYKQFQRFKMKVPAHVWKVDRNELFQGRNVYLFATTVSSDGSIQPPTRCPVTLTYNLTTYFTDM